MSESICYLSYPVLEKLPIACETFIHRFEQLIFASEKDAAWSAPKSVILTPDGRYIMATLAAASSPSFVATKSLVLNERNLDKGLPQINSLVTLLDGETGVPVAIIDGNWVTAVRTAGLSAVAAKYLARSDSETIGFIGSGVQASSHLHAFAQLYPLRKIKIWSRGQHNIDALCRYAKTLDLAYEVCDTPHDAVSDVDIAISSVTHTAIQQPFMDTNWLSDGCFLCSIELGMAWHKNSFATLDRLIIDDQEQESTSPHKLAYEQDISGDLSELITGKVIGRRHYNERTAFVFRGHTLGDLVSSILAYEKYNESK